MAPGIVAAFTCSFPTRPKPNSCSTLIDTWIWFCRPNCRHVPFTFHSRRCPWAAIWNRASRRCLLRPLTQVRIVRIVSAVLNYFTCLVGRKKPKFPFTSVTQSALLFIAIYHKAKNPHMTEYTRAKWSQILDEFNADCDSISFLGRKMTRRYRAPSQVSFILLHYSEY